MLGNIRVLEASGEGIEPSAKVFMVPEPLYIEICSHLGLASSSNSVKVLDKDCLRLST